MRKEKKEIPDFLDRIARDSQGKNPFSARKNNRFRNNHVDEQKKLEV